MDREMAAGVLTNAGTAPDNPIVVSTAAGPVTLADIETLKRRLDQAQRDSTEKLGEAQSLGQLYDERLVDVGQLLLDHRSEWTQDDAARPLVERAVELQSRLASDNSQLETLQNQDRHGLNRLVGKVRGWNENRKVTADKTSAESQLRDVLTNLAQTEANVVELQGIGVLREQAEAAKQQSSDLTKEAALLTSSARLLADEISRRQEALKEMGFDSLYTAAYLQTHGPQPVQSPLNLKSGERAIAVAPAKLARNQTRTRWVGGSQGFSFPIGHTGIRYRVGSYHGQPVQQQILTTLDVGTFVVTTQRVAFVGRTKTVSIALSKLVHVQCYSDALAIFHEGRENADYFLVAQPKYVLFMINWASGQPAS